MDSTFGDAHGEVVAAVLFHGELDIVPHPVDDERLPAEAQEPFLGRAPVDPAADEVHKVGADGGAGDACPAQGVAAGVAEIARVPAQRGQLRGQFSAEVGQPEDEDGAAGFAIGGRRAHAGGPGGATARALGDRTVVPGGTSRSTRACAPMTAPAPTVTPWRMVAPRPR